MIAEGGCTLGTSTTTASVPTSSGTTATDVITITTEAASTETTTPGICPEGSFGNIPHPELCNSWFMCAGGISIQLFCSEGFEFDPNHGVSIKKL